MHLGSRLSGRWPHTCIHFSQEATMATVTVTVLHIVNTQTGGRNSLGMKLISPTLWYILSVSQHSISDLSGLKLTSDDLGCVMEEVVDVSAEWYNLGLQLKVRTAELDSIRAQTSTPKIQLREMLNIWLRTGDDPSWETLTDALRSRSVGANRLASTLKQKYCLVEETEVNRYMSAPGCLPATPPPVSESVVPTLQPQVAEMQGSE